jgi:hypothetical protein
MQRRFRCKEWIPQESTKTAPKSYIPQRPENMAPQHPRQFDKPPSWPHVTCITGTVVPLFLHMPPLVSLNHGLAFLFTVLFKVLWQIQTWNFSRKHFDFSKHFRRNKKKNVWLRWETVEDPHKRCNSLRNTAFCTFCFAPWTCGMKWPQIKNPWTWHGEIDDVVRMMVDNVTKIILLWRAPCHTQTHTRPHVLQYPDTLLKNFMQ